MTPDRSGVGGREQLCGVNRTVIKLRFVGRCRHGRHVSSSLVVAAGLRDVKEMLVGGRYGLGTKRRTGRGLCHPVNGA